MKKVRKFLAPLFAFCIFASNVTVAYAANDIQLDESLSAVITEEVRSEEIPGTSTSITIWDIESTLSDKDLAILDAGGDLYREFDTQILDFPIVPGLQWNFEVHCTISEKTNGNGYYFKSVGTIIHIYDSERFYNWGGSKSTYEVSDSTLTLSPSKEPTAITVTAEVKVITSTPYDIFYEYLSDTYVTEE